MTAVVPRPCELLIKLSNSPNVIHRRELLTKMSPAVCMTNLLVELGLENCNLFRVKTVLANGIMNKYLQEKGTYRLDSPLSIALRSFASSSFSLSWLA